VVCSEQMQPQEMEVAPIRRVCRLDDHRHARNAVAHDVWDSRSKREALSLRVRRTLRALRSPTIGDALAQDALVLAQIARMEQAGVARVMDVYEARHPKAQCRSSQERWQERSL